MQLLTRRKLIGDTALYLCGASLLRSQDNHATSGASPTFSSDVKVVNVYVTVRDKKGHLVTGLNKEDFALSEDGNGQDIRYFARQSDLPLTLGLVVDTTPSEHNMLTVERDTSNEFFQQVLRPEMDRAFVIQFGDAVELLQDLTSSRASLEKALDRLTSSDDAGGGGPRDPGGRRGNGGSGGPDSTVLSDAIYLASNDVLKSQTGRKAIILLGDGDHIGNRESEAISAAERADTAVYSIRIYDRDFGGGNPLRRALSIPGIPGMGGGPGGGGPGGGGPGGGGPGGGGPGGGGPMSQRSDGKKHLQDLSTRTGGAYFEVSKNKSLTDIYDEIQNTLRNQYSLGYTPQQATDSNYRRIRVTVKQHGLTVQAREGYYYRPPAQQST